MRSVSWRRCVLFAAAMTLTSICDSQTTGGTPLPIALGQHQLFLDDYVILKQTGLERKLHTPQKHPLNPVLKREKPWEAFRVQVYGTILYDQDADLFKAWYMNIPDTAANKITVNGQNRPGHATLLSYATSPDGLQWFKPVLDLVDFEGSTENNMIAPELYNPEGFSVLYEPHDPNLMHRYKALYWDHGFGPLIMHEGQEIYGEGEKDGIHAAFSPDGIHWTPYAGNPVLKVGSDSGHCVLFDPALGKYVAFSRFGFGRKVARIESADFIHWSPPELVIEPDAADGPDTEIYGISVDLYDGLYIGMLWMFDIQEGNVGTIDMQLCHSRDGRTWTRDPERRVFLGRGREGAWDGGDLRAACRSVVLDDRILIYYAGSAALHGLGGKQNIGMDIGLATLRRDGWMSLSAEDSQGSFVTKTLIHPGGDLYVNSAASYGSVRVAVLDEKGARIPGLEAEIAEDNVRAKAVFPENTFAPLAGQPIHLLFTISHTEMYSFWFEQNGDILPEPELTAIEF